MVGYSEKSLSDKLGMKMGDNISILHAPDNYDDLIGGWPVGASVSRDVLDETFTFMHYFARSEDQLATDLIRLKEHLDKKGMLWISWPKQSALRQAQGVKGGIESDLDESVVRHLGLAAGLVDVKVAAIDEVWSGLKFVWRVKDR